MQTSFSCYCFIYLTTIDTAAVHLHLIYIAINQTPQGAFCTSIARKHGCVSYMVVNSMIEKKFILQDIFQHTGGGGAILTNRIINTRVQK